MSNIVGLITIEIKKEPDPRFSAYASLTLHFNLILKKLPSKLYPYKHIATHIRRACAAETR